VTSRAKRAIHLSAGSETQPADCLECKTNIRFPSLAVYHAPVWYSLAAAREEAKTA
jgi:hypothetical protein